MNHHASLQELYIPTNRLSPAVQIPSTAILSTGGSHSNRSSGGGESPTQFTPGYAITYSER